MAVNPQNVVGIFENHADIGPVINKGTAIYDATARKYTLTSAGNNMRFKKDEFHFVWKKLKGDFIITTQPTLVGSGGDPHKKAGIIVHTGIDTLRLWCV